MIKIWGKSRGVMRALLASRARDARKVFSARARCARARAVQNFLRARALRALCSPNFFHARAQTQRIIENQEFVQSIDNFLGMI